MANVTRTIESYRTGEYYLNELDHQESDSWDSWTNMPSVSNTVQCVDYVSTSQFGTINDLRISCFKIAAGTAGDLSSLTVLFNIIGTSENHAGGFIGYLFTSDPTGGSVKTFDTSAAITAQSVSVSNGYVGTKSVSFSGLSLQNSDTLYIAIVPSRSGDECAVTLTANTSYPVVTASVVERLTVATSYPKNITRTATDSMLYSWTVSGSTTQTKSELYINGSKRAEVTGANTYIESSYRPPAGTVAWYVKVTNNLGVVSQSDTATFTIQYVSTSYLAPYNTKTSGSIDRFSAQTFAVQMQANGTPYTDYTCNDAVFFWRQSGETSWNSVSMTRPYGVDNRAAVTIPANTLPKGTIQWYASAGDGQGNTRTTSTYNLSTVAVSITATPTAPIDTIETANTPTVFTWLNSGTITIYPAAAQLQYSTDNVIWTDFGSVTGSASTYTAEAGALPSGQLFWRVRVQNVDDVWGSWSDPVTFSNFGAPSVSQVIADDKPFTTITWTSSTQQAYRITIDGSVVYGTYWGANVHAFTLPLPLADGAHTAAVEVQNAYEQWSQPAQTDFTVTNVPSDPVTLTGLFDRDAELSWSTTDATSDFLIYRDGVQIGHASGRSFTDRVVLGYHSWRVINRLPGGYYTASNVISGTLMTGRLAIAPLSGGAWLELAKSENSARSVVWNESQRVALRQFAGQIYPQAEAAPYKTMSAGFDVAWTHAEAEQAAVFASLIGQPVIFKTPCEGAMVGILTAWQRNNMHFYRSYSATVQRIHWRDFVDADD